MADFDPTEQRQAPNRQTMAFQPTWNSDAEMLEMIREEEARERMKSKTTDSLADKPEGRGVIDDTPIVASKRKLFWEEALKKQKQ